MFDHKQGLTGKNRQMAQGFSVKQNFLAALGSSKKNVGERMGENYYKFKLVQGYLFLHWSQTVTN